MKKINLLLLGVLLCAFALHSNAQSVPFTTETFWNFKVNCDGVVDIISGQVHVQGVEHHNPVTGVKEWYKYNLFSKELVSANTGEVFSVNRFQKGKTDGDFAIWPFTGDIYTTSRFNLRGDQGSHYLVTLIGVWDFSTGITTTLKKTVKRL